MVSNKKIRMDFDDADNVNSIKFTAYRPIGSTQPMQFTMQELIACSEGNAFIFAFAIVDIFLSME